MLYLENLSFVSISQYLNLLYAYGYRQKNCLILIFRINDLIKNLCNIMQSFFMQINLIFKFLNHKVINK